MDENFTYINPQVKQTKCKQKQRKQFESITREKCGSIHDVTHTRIGRGYICTT